MKHIPVHQLFSQAANKFWAATAIDGGDKRITYGDLEARARRVASALASLGIARGAIVAILAEDVIDIVTAIIGILKAGGVFCPLDPRFPDKRLTVMCDIVKPQWFVIEPRFWGKLNGLFDENGGPKNVICLGEDELEGVVRQVVRIGRDDCWPNPELSEPECDPDGPCSIYFTSGSTGRPKPIAGRLKGIDHFILWETEALEVGTGTRISQLTSPSFDGFLKDVFVPLSVGGVVCAPETREILLDPGRLIRWIEEQKVEILHCVPSVFRLIINEGLDGHLFRALKYVVMAGETLLPADVKRWIAVYGDRIRLVNLYGTTETTVAKLFYFVTRADADRPTIPVGTPMEGAAAMVVNVKGKPCPPGMVGEIYIRTPYCALGYYSEPELTREAFIQNPFNNDPNDIVHRTGDYGRVLKDGNLEYLGRRDQQVKIRGVRVELGEIENALREHAVVREGVVIDHEDKGGLKYLCAYVVADTGGGASAGALREHLMERLPEYMVPSAFILMESLPRTLNGKVDRRALPKPSQIDRQTVDVAPRTPVEEILVGIWVELLGVTTVGIHDNFFEMGGHSLLATQVVSRMREALKVEVPLRELFEAPTVAGLSARLEREIRAGSGIRTPELRPVARDGDLPLSFAQERLWFLDQLEPGDTAYNGLMAMQLEGPLSVGALEQDLGEVVRRHETLRTTFPTVDGRPVQMIARAEPATLPIVDLSKLDEGKREYYARNLAMADRRRPFDLVMGPLMRVTLLRQGRLEHTVLCATHHIMSDGWSMGVLVREVSLLYEAFSSGVGSSLAEIEIQYADYAAWHREWLRGEVLEAELSYWKKHLAKAAPLLELPTDRPRPAVQTSRGARQPVHLPLKLVTGLKELSRRTGVTLFMTLLAGFKALLHRYTKQADIIVGTNVANRQRAELEGLIGFFVNMLVLRTDCSGNPSFEELLERVREVALQAYMHQEAPFEKLVEEMEPERNLSHPPLFQVVFSMQNAPRSSLALAGLKLSVLDFENDTAKYDMVVHVWESEQGIDGTLEYNTDLFDGSTIRSLFDRYQILLEAIVEDPGGRLSEISLLSEEERRLQLVTWNEPEAEYVVEQCIHELFEEQARRRPDAVALSLEGESLTYGELDRRSNQVSRYLARLGIGPEALVGILLERSLEMAIGLLGVMKAGGAHVPLEASNPRQRLEFMTFDSGIDVVLTQEVLEDLIQPGIGKIHLDSDREFWAESTDRLDSGAVAGNAAYVIYTSGSTGQPKGVVVSHSNVVRLFLATETEFHFDSSDTWTLFHSHAFDFSVWELWGALLHGGRCVIVPYWVSRSPGALYTLMEEERVTVLNQTPSAFQQFMRVEETEGLKSRLCLRLVIFGGEALELRMLRPWYERHREEETELVNMYGITETTVHVTLRRLEKADVVEAGGSVIGGPIPDLQVYLLDSYYEAVPIGVPGEIWVGGAGLARGYLGRPELTAERFVPDPYSRRAGDRLYKSGDVGQRLPEGDIKYVGRSDAQVKIRGFRIEVGEVERALGEHPAVREAVIEVRGNGVGDKQLVAYMVAEEEKPTVGELRTFLEDRLPKYMVPSAFVTLTEMPLTSNGKVDRRALIALEPARPDVGVTYVTPRTETEIVLAGIWSEILRIDRVGIYDNFFELGGDSILSIQVIARAARAGLRLTAKQLFQYQTIAELTAVVESTDGSAGYGQEPVTGSVPLTPIQHWFFEQGLPDLHHFNQAVLLETLRNLDPNLLERAVEHLLVHHDALRLRFHQSDTGWEQRDDAPNKDTPFAHIDLSAVPESRRQRVLEQSAAEVQTSLDVENGPLIRVVFFQYGTGESGRLLVVVHHLAVDGVSWRILLEDLQTVYTDLSNGTSVKLPLKTMSYQEWARRLQDFSLSEALESQASYWSDERHRFSSWLPVDIVDGRNTLESARTVTVELTEEETRQLLHRASDAYRTQINDLLMTALLQAIAEWSGAVSVVVDLEGHGREDLYDGIDLSRTVGWFTSIYPVALELESDRGLGAALKSVKEQLRKIPNRGVGYGVLRYLRGGDDAISKLRLIQRPEISFNYLGQLDQALPEKTPFALAPESSGPNRSSRGERTHLFEISGRVIGGRLRVDWTYSENSHRAETVRGVTESYIGWLRKLISHCISPEAAGYTPSDFPLARLDQEELDRTLADKQRDRQIEDLYPLSPLQEGLLFHSLAAPGGGLYVTQVASRLDELDVAVFRRAWQQVIDRHPVFRTSFLWKEVRRPLQLVRRSVEVPLASLDWRSISYDDQRERLKGFLDQDRAKGFDLSTPPLMRLTLIRLKDQSYEFVWTHHHLLLDGWSTYLVIKEFLELYEAAYQGRSANLPVSHPYREYVAWIERQDLLAAEAYWRESLKGFTAPTQLRRGLTAPANGGTGRATYDQQVRRIGAGLTGRLTAVARRERLTLNTILQSVWGLLLSWYCGEEDVVFAGVVAGRPPDLPGVESMVGLFINTLPVRVPVDPDASISSWLKLRQEQQALMRQFEYSPLVRVQQWSEVRRGLPLFETLFVFENYPIDASLSEQRIGLQVSDFRVLEKLNYPMAIIVAQGVELSVGISYEASIFDATTITRIGRHFEFVVERLAACLETRSAEPGVLRALNGLDDSERHQLLIELNDTRVERTDAKCLHRLFEEQVEKTPDRTAIVCADEHVRYIELNARANSLARYLKDLGVESSAPVGVFLERSVELLVGLLGILKAGAAYLPLDPDYPRDRLRILLEDGRVRVILSESRLLTELPPVAESKAVCLDEHWGDIEKELETNPECQALPDTLAYVIFTSGSTGRPKGASNTHLGICNRLLWMQSAYELSDADVVVQKTPISFDVSAWELFWPLIAGARLVMARPGGQKDASYLVRFVTEQSATTIHFVPSMLRAFMDDPEVANCKSLRQVICSGEALGIEHQRQFFLELGAGLHNLYGPTEAAVDVTYWECERESRELTVPIGRPIHNTQIYLLDGEARPVPLGLAGELHIGGEGVARGYFDRPDLTAEKFVPDSFGPEGGGRLYKTGDLAAFLPDGRINFLSRIDHQVKIRGVRIELGEIESVLRLHPAVREVVVVVREDSPSDMRLVAYLVAEREQGGTTSEWRRFLEERLPESMVPSAFILLESMPLTPNGKVDRRALPAPGQTRPVLDDAYVAPRTELERTIAGIWQDALQVDNVGMNDNYFDLGGHSLLMIQVHARLQQVLTREISLVDLFDHPNINSLARYLSLHEEQEPLTSELDAELERLTESKDRLRKQLRRSQRLLNL